jgi:hypothetical protein
LRIRRLRRRGAAGSERVRRSGTEVADFSAAAALDSRAAAR